MASRNPAATSGGGGVHTPITKFLPSLNQHHVMRHSAEDQYHGSQQAYQQISEPLFKGKNAGGYTMMHGA